MVKRTANQIASRMCSKHASAFVCPATESSQFMKCVHLFGSQLFHQFGRQYRSMITTVLLQTCQCALLSRILLQFNTHKRPPQAPAASF